LTRLRTAFLIFLLPSSSIAAPSELSSLDHEVANRFPRASYEIATSIGRPDDEGLIGRNREWGDLYSVRFQYGSGRALRQGLATQDVVLMRLARGAIRAGLESIEPDGAFPASLPKNLFPNTEPGPSDQASAAAFFMSDVCPALMIAGPSADETAQARAAMEWLSARQGVLLRKDALAPNRLLIDGLAFASCGALLGDEKIAAQAGPFIDAALEMLREDGVFLEAGGSDTSYQSVAIVVGLEVIALELAGSRQEDLTVGLRLASQWLQERVAPDGVLDSTGNTRTCASETFLGRSKDVDLREVFRALAYAGATFEDGDTAAARFAGWLRTRPVPCDPVN